MSTTDGLVIPVSTPGADKAAEDLGRVAAATAQVGHGATEMGASVARGGNTSAQALAAIGASAARSESHLADLKVTGNQALQELGQKGAEFARSIGGAGGAVAELGVKILATAGPYGAMAAAALGAIGMISAALDEHNAALARDQAVTDSLASSTRELGAAYPSVAAAVSGAATAQAAHTAAARENMSILQQQITLMSQGMSGAEATSFSLALQRISEASKDATTGLATLSPAMIQHAALSGNAAEQERVLGVNIEHSTNQYVERANVVTRLAAAERNRLAQRVQELEEQRQSILNDTNSTATSKLQQLRANEVALEAARNSLATATGSLTTATEAGNAANREQLEHQRDLLRLADAERDRLNDKAEAEKRATAALAAHTAAAAGPSAQEQRAAVEALRVAREANENAGRTVPLTESQAQAQRALAFATNEVALAERALRTGSHTTAERASLTTALNAQTQAQTAYRDSVEATARATADLLTKERDRLALQDAALQNKSALEAEREKDRTAAEDAANAQRRATSQAALMQNQSAQQASIAKLQSDRMDALKSSAEGLAGGFVSAGIAAAIAGEAIGPAMQKALSASLSSLAQQAAVKSLFELAEGFAALGSNPIAAPTHFTSAAIFAGVAVAAGAGAAATAPAPAAPASGGGAPAPAAGGMGTMNTGTSGGGSNNTVINYYAPTFGGREGGIGEVGQQIDRYRRDNTALRRSR